MRELTCGIVLILFGAVSPASAQGLWNGLFSQERAERIHDSPTLPALLLGLEADEKEEGEDDSIYTDRPDFTEASRNVGRGRLQLESGYTFFRDRQSGVETRRHSYPELLIRYGIFEWLEVRLGQNVADERARGNGVQDAARGAEDMYLGLGINLSKQKKVIPESRILLFATVPSGSSEVTFGQVMPGFNFLYGWELTEKVTIHAGTQMLKASDAPGRFHLLVAHSTSFDYAITKKLSSYVEGFALLPSGADTALPEYYTDGGFTYKITPDLQLDIRAGIGLNRHATDFFIGSGLSVRF